jgi:hypothetical protein
MGQAASMAFDVLQCCDYRTIEYNAHLMTHEEQLTGDSASSSASVASGRFSHKIEKICYASWSARTGRPVSYYTEQLKTEWWMTAEEALGEGFVDEIIYPPPFRPSPATVPMKRAKRVYDEDEPDDPPRRQRKRRPGSSRLRAPVGEPANRAERPAPTAN